MGPTGTRAAGTSAAREVRNLLPEEPCSSAIRKWIPEYTRASTISSIACEKRVKLLVVFETPLSALNSALSVSVENRRPGRCTARRRGGRRQARTSRSARSPPPRRDCRSRCA